MRRTPKIDDMPSVRRKGERSSRPDAGSFENRQAVPYEADWGPSPPPGFINVLSDQAKPNRPAEGRVNGLRNGRINGLKGGRVNGLQSGMINGLRKGWAYGLTNGGGALSGTGRINGLKNGRTNGIRNGRVNGFTNGRVNGHSNGRTNGNGRKSGLINGNGFVNGFRLTSAPKSIPLTRKNPSMRMVAVFAVVALVVIIPFVLVYSMPEDLIRIDGKFFDWNRAGYFSEPPGAVAPDIDIREYSIVHSGDTIYGYIATAAPMFQKGGGMVASFFVFLEMDSNPLTGYIIDGIGADVMVEIIGWNGTVQPSACNVYNFASNADRNNFLGFGEKRSIDVRGAENKVEFSFWEVDAGNPEVRFFSKDCCGLEDLSQYSIRYGEPALRVGVNFTLPEIISLSAQDVVMGLEFSTLRGDASISELDFKQLGNATAYTISLYDGGRLISKSNGSDISFSPALEVREGYGRLLSLAVSADGSQTGSSFGLSLNASGVNVSGEVTVTVSEEQSGAKVAYIGAVPSRVVIDGAFGDWINGYIMPDSAGDVKLKNGTIIGDRSIDMVEYGMYVDSVDLAMYLSVEDLMLNGTILPKDVELPVPSTGLPPLNTSEMLGTDIAGAVIDSDWNQSTGADFNGVLGADHLVLITGKKGRIVLSELYSWNATGNGSWEFEDAVRSAVDRRHMEFAFNFSDIPLGSYDVAAVGFFMTDWKGGSDYSDGALPLGKWQIGNYMKAFGGMIINEVLNTKGQVDFIEVMNTGTQPITLTGWSIYDGTTSIYTFGTVTVNPGSFFVVSGLTISKAGSIRMVDQSGAVIDAVTAKENANARSFARTGDPPYSTWKPNMQPTPGVLNPGQVAIPEFSDFVVPALLIPALFFAIRMKRRRETGRS